MVARSQVRHPSGLRVHEVSCLRTRDPDDYATCLVPAGGGGGGGCLRVSCVTMREKKTKKKNDDKGYYFRAEQCASLSSFRPMVGKMLFL